MNIQVAPLASFHFEELRVVLDVVAREQRFLAFTKAPPVEQAYAFYRNSISNDHSHFVALIDGAVCGWCDVLPTHGEARSHIGILGIGLVPSARHKGVGRLLMQAAIAKTQFKGLSRIELTVRTDNFNAKALYERFGFRVEGVNVRSFLIDGEYYDTYAMALLQ